ncbi:MAG TPA: hypothetical protein VGD45_19050 [Steroidobacter sp.]|uniref:hypothetical protein n=1 Tax=Steroidobacter sp. TaxID=1978227 RepID=UPI002ED86C19
MNASAKAHMFGSVLILVVVVLLLNATSASRSDPPADRQPATVQAQAAPMPAPSSVPQSASQDHVEVISALAQSSIEAANRSAEHTKLVYELALAVVGIFGVALTFVGITNMKSLVATAEKQAHASVNGIVEALKKQIAELTEQTRVTADHAKMLMLETATACRHYNLADWSNYAESRKAYLQDAIKAAGKVREAAKQLSDTRHEAWSYSFEALCRADLGELDVAIATLEKSINCYKRDDASLDYNMACYCCRAGQDDKGAESLRRALAQDAKTGNTLSMDALDEPDFNDWRRKNIYADLVGTELRPERQAHIKEMIADAVRHAMEASAKQAESA